MTHSIILDADKRLSQSLIWDIQRTYFLKSGMSAWQDDIVPHAISCDPYMARAYGEVILGYLRDCLADQVLEPDEPIYIVELGAGSGRLTYHLLHQLMARLPHTPFAELNVQFVLTDFVPATLDFYQTRPQLQKWVNKGILHYAHFDVTDMKAPIPTEVNNPVILLANYFFDSIPQDSFVLADGQLNHNLLTLYSSQPETDLGDATLWERLSLDYEAIPLFAEPYDNEIYAGILAAYEAEFPDMIFTFPNVGLDCVRFWQQFGGGRNLWLTADRGYTLPESLLGQGNPLPNLHGSFSLMVNYDAINQYVLACGGYVFHPPHYQDNMQVLAYVLGDAPNEALETAAAFNAGISQRGPDDFFALKRVIETQYDAMALPQMLAWLRFCVWDAEVFRDLMPTFLDKLREADPAWHTDVYEAVRQVWASYLPIRKDDNLQSLIKRILGEIGADWFDLAD
jgi:hypothetical protein